MTPELEFDSLLFELDKNMTRVHSSITHDVCTSLRVIVASLHERNLKLEARIAELERMHSFSNNIDVADDLFKRAAKADRDLRHANARATVNKILGVEEPIEGMVERAVAHDMEVVFSGKPVEELTESQKELRKLLLNTWVTVKPDKFTREHGNLPVSAAIDAIDCAVGSVITAAGGKTRTAAEHLYGTKTSDTVGYIPDDFRG